MINLARATYSFSSIFSATVQKQENSSFSTVNTSTLVTQLTRRAPISHCIYLARHSPLSLCTTPKLIHPFILFESTDSCGSCYLIKMAAVSGTSNPVNRKQTRLPPKRGQIKVGIFSKFVNMVVRAVSKARRGQERKKKVAQETQSPQPHGSKNMAQKKHCDILLK